MQFLEICVELRNLVTLEIDSDDGVPKTSVMRSSW